MEKKTSMIEAKCRRNSSAASSMAGISSETIDNFTCCAISALDRF